MRYLASEHRLWLPSSTCQHLLRSWREAVRDQLHRGIGSGPVADSVGGLIEQGRVVLSPALHWHDRCDRESNAVAGLRHPARAAARRAGRPVVPPSRRISDGALTDTRMRVPPHCWTPPKTSPGLGAEIMIP